MGDKYWEESNEFLRFFAKAYLKLIQKKWTNSQYNQEMANFYMEKGMLKDAQYHQEIADNGYALPHSIKDKNIP